MSVSWLIYRADPKAGPINSWDSDRSDGIARVDAVRRRLSEIFPDLVWTEGSITYSGATHTYHSALSRGAGADYVDLQIRAEADGLVHVISARKASPSVVRRIVEAFSLNQVYQD